MEVEASQTAAGEGRGAVAWILRHDDSRIFVALYVGLALVLSIVWGLFWLVAVVAVHFAFEVLKHWRLDPHPGRVLIRAAWELKLDLALILFALCLALYLELALGMAGLGAAARAGVQTGARFVVWQKALRAVLLSLDDAAQVLRAVLGRRRGAPRADEPLPVNTSLLGGWAGRWGIGDWFALGFGALCASLILLGPVFTDYTPGSLLAALLDDLRPFPAD